MFRKRIAALAAVAVLMTGPAFAVCNPGTPHCIRLDPNSRLAALKNKLKNPGTLGSGDQQCKNSKLCGIDTGDGTSPGYLSRKSGNPSYTTTAHANMQFSRHR